MSDLAAEPATVRSADPEALGHGMSVAALLLTIDHDQAARVMRGFDHDQLEQVTRAMGELADRSVDRNDLYRILVEATHRVSDGQHALGDVASQVESVLGRAFGEDNSRAPNEDEDADQVIAKRRFALFEALSSLDLANLLSGEHPQIAAVFIAHLGPVKAAAVVNRMAESKRPDLVYRIATLDRTPHDVVQRVLDVMTQKVESLGLTARRAEPRTWINAAAEIVKKLGPENGSVLHAIAERSGDLAASIRDEMFTFEDIAALDRRAVQRLLSLVETRTLVLALKATTLAVEEVFFDNLSKRAREMVAEERDLLAPTPLSKVFDAQRTILRTIRELTERGEIVPPHATGEKMV